MQMKYNPRMLKVGNVGAINKLCKQLFDDGLIRKGSYIDYFMLNRGLIENGTMGDPFMHEEATFNNTYNLMSVAEAYKIPLYFNTKLNAVIESRTHFDKICDLTKTGVLIDASLTGNDNDLLKRFEPKAPSVDARFKIIEKLTDNNVDVIGSARPIIAGVTDVDFEAYIERFCHSGVKSIHLRSLIITGAQLRNQFWKDFAKKHDMLFKNISYRYKHDYFMDLFERANDVAKSFGTTITASHTMFFKFGTANKCDYSKMSKPIQNSLFRPGVADLLQKTYEHKDEPKVLYFDEIIKPWIEKEKSFMDYKFLINSNTAQLIWSTSCTHKIPAPFLITGEKIFTNAIWDGWESGIGRNKTKMSIGYLATTNQIFVVVNNKGRNVLDDNNHCVYAYIPEEQNDVHTKSSHTTGTIPTITRQYLRKEGLW